MTEAFKYMNMRVMKNKVAVQNSPIFLLPLLLFIVSRCVLIVFTVCTRSVHGLFPYHLRFTSGDTLFFLWLALAEERGI